MSYNVDSFRVKKMEGFTLPLAAVKEMAEEEPHQGVNGELSFDRFWPEGMEVVGTPDKDKLLIRELSYFGEGSGRYWNDFEDLLKQSTGTLQAVVCWEGGDTIEILTITDGTIERETL